MQLSGIYSYAIHLWQIWLAPPSPQRNSHHQNFYMWSLGDPLVQPSFATSAILGPGGHPKTSPSFCWHLTHTMESSSKSLRVSKVGLLEKTRDRFCWMGQEIWWFKVWEFGPSKDNGAQVLLDRLEMTSSLHFRFRKKWSILQGTANMATKMLKWICSI